MPMEIETETLYRQESDDLALLEKEQLNQNQTLCIDMTTTELLLLEKEHCLCKQVKGLYQSCKLFMQI